MAEIIYRFDSFMFDRERGLLDAGKRIPLELQVLNLLSYLLDNRDRVVSRDELYDQIWGGRIVSDAALSTRIRAVRRALGDDRSQQKYVRTHPKRGFQFVAPVDLVSDADVPPERRPRLPRQYSVYILILVVAVTVSAAIGAWWINRERSAIPGPLPKLSIAVLPFDNLSGDPEQDYFADAITEDLITDLSRIRDAFVIARRTSFTYKGQSTDVATVAAELGVRYVLEGSVRRVGDLVRISAQLIDGKTNSHLWSGRFDRELTDAFSVQNAVTGRIAAVLKAELRQADLERQGPPSNLEAWDYALRGNVLLFNPKSLAEFQHAKSLLDKALALDPNIASAWSGLAFVHFAASLRPIPGVSEANSKILSLEAAQRSVSLDPKNAEGHWMIGVGYARNGETQRAMASCETAMDLNPNNDCAYVCAGLTKMAQGQPTEAIPYFQHSLRLNPNFRPFTKYKYMGLAYLHSGQDAEAIAVLNRAIVGSPNDPVSNFALTAALALSGRTKEASAALEKSLKLAYSAKTTIATLRASQSWMGPGFERVLEGLRLAGLPEG